MSTNPCATPVASAGVASGRVQTRPLLCCGAGRFDDMPFEMDERGRSRTCEQGGDVMALAERWLGLCRLREDEVASIGDHPEVELAFGQVSREAEQLFGKLSPEISDRIMPSDAPELARSFAAAAVRLESEARAALAFATALERTRGPQFLPVFAPEGTRRRLRPGQLVPISRRHLQDALGRVGLSVRESSRGPTVDHLDTVVLLPDNLHGFQLDAQRLPQGTLDVLNDDFSIGFALLSQTFLPLAEYAIEPSERHPNEELKQSRRFFWVRPFDAAQQCEVMLRLLRKADDAGVRVLVFPELCHTIDRGDSERHVDTWQSMIDWFNGRERKHLRVLIAGSRHVERETERGEKERRNELLVLVHGCPTWVHNKFNPMLLGREPSRTHREHIHTSPRTMTLFLDRDWSFVPLICKDFLLNEARALLQSLSPGLVLISSMSDKTQDFERDALGFTSACQAVVVYSNIALEPSGDPPAPAALGFVTRPLLETRHRPSKKAMVRVETPHPKKFSREQWAAPSSPGLGTTWGSGSLKRWRLRRYDM
jgi:predicted amidohydrolase